MLICVVYVLVTCFFIIAYRKHYTVDLMVGFFIAGLMWDIFSLLSSSSVVFRDGWQLSMDPLEPSYEALPTSASV